MSIWSFYNPIACPIHSFTCKNDQLVVFKHKHVHTIIYVGCRSPSDAVSIHDWTGPYLSQPVSPEEKKQQNTNRLLMKKWQSMDRNIWEVECFNLDGVYFRTAPMQHRKGTITDNSCITGESGTTCMRHTH
jgi:hypothetical protein